MPKDLPALARQHYIGGGDIPAILGISPYSTPLELFLRKRGATEIPDNPVLRRGRRLEPYVRDIYAEETGRKIFAPAFVIGSEPWIGGNIDGMSGAPTADRVLEIKTANEFTRRDWGEQGTDQIPVYYTAQIQWYLMITRFARADLAALIGLDDFRIFTVEADVGLQEWLLVKARAFWQRIHDNDPPPAVSEEDLRLLFPQHQTGAVVEADDVDCGIVSELRMLRQQAKELEDREATLRMSIEAKIGPAEALVLDGKPLATWKTQNRKAIDVKALRAERADVAEAFERTTSCRVFRLK